MPNNNDTGAFGWKKGTVRAILAFGIWIGIFALLFCVLGFGWEVPEMVIAFIGSVVGGGITILGFYFGKRAGEETPESGETISPHDYMKSIETIVNAVNMVAQSEKKKSKSTN